MTLLSQQTPLICLSSSCWDKIFIYFSSGLVLDIGQQTQKEELNINVYRNWYGRSSTNKLIEEFPLWLSGLRTWHSVCEDVGLILGLAQCVKDSGLPQAVV